VQQQLLQQQQHAAIAHAAAHVFPALPATPSLPATLQLPALSSSLPVTPSSMPAALAHLAAPALSALPALMAAPSWAQPRPPFCLCGGGRLAALRQSASRRYPGKTAGIVAWQCGLGYGAAGSCPLYHTMRYAAAFEAGCPAATGAYAPDRWQ